MKDPIEHDPPPSPNATMTISGVGIEFDFSFENIAQLPFGTLIEFVWWPTATTPLSLGKITTDVNEVPESFFPAQLIGGSNVPPSQSSLMPHDGDILSIQISFDGSTWLQVTPVDISGDGVDLVWHPSGFFYLYGLRRPV